MDFQTFTGSRAVEFERMELYVLPEVVLRNVLLSRLDVRRAVPAGPVTVFEFEYVIYLAY